MTLEDSNMVANAICYSVSTVQEYFQGVAHELTRPAILFKPRLFPDGDQWCALLGEDLQVGVCGFGASPADAMRDFDKEWNTKLKAGK
jgi:hypothetical protein